MKELYVGCVYNDPDGTWEVTKINDKNVEICCIDSKVNTDIGKEYIVPKEEALYFIENEEW